MLSAWWRGGEEACPQTWTLVEPILMLGGAGSQMLRHRASNRDIFVCVFIFFGPPPPITHTQSLQRQSDRTATLRIRVRCVEHVVCHINSSCQGKFGKLAPPPSQPIIGIGYEVYRPNSTMLWTESSEGSWSSVGLNWELNSFVNLIPQAWSPIDPHKLVTLPTLHSAGLDFRWCTTTL